MEFRILGPLEAVDDGRRLALGTPSAKAVLAILLARAGTIVSTDQLADELWPDTTPVDVRAEIYSYISRLRSALRRTGRQWVVTRSPGYLLRLEHGELDLHRFDDLVTAARAARQADDLQTCVELYREAHELWRGAPFVGLPSTPILAVEAARLTEYQLTIREELFDAELAAGQAAELIAGLRTLVDQHPLRERLRAQLMLALYRSGRQAEALGVFDAVREALAEELGIDPGPELVDLRQRMLRGDQGLAVARPVVSLRRNSLPGDVLDFVGRADEIRHLSGWQSPVVIDGMAGVGKTTLAVHVAHQLADLYPDAQLFVDLQAHTEGQDPVEPIDALAVLLRALGVNAERIPDGLAGRTALWRAELAGRKALVVLDNALDAAQVRPLLPGTPNCLALVTSRRRVADIEAAHGLTLEVLPAADAMRLFTRVLGNVADPVAAAEVLRLCGYLPLAIRIAAARLRARPAWTTAHLACRLRDEHRRLAELKAGDRCVATAFTLSYQHLSEEQQRLFRLLGLVPGPDFDAYVAAALLDTSLDRADRLLEDLVDAHLLQQLAPYRYRFHDLLRRHAFRTAHETEPEHVRQEVVERLLDYYLHTSNTAAGLIDPEHNPIDVKPTLSPHFSTYTHAVAWQDTECSNLLAAIDCAASHGLHTHTWKLSSTLKYFYFYRNRIGDGILGGHLALRAARQLGDRDAEADVLNKLGVAHERLNRNKEAVDYLSQALAIARDTGNQVAEGNALNYLGMARYGLNEHERALDCLHDALDLARRTGNRIGQGNALNSLGIVHRRLARHEEALTYFEQALAFASEAGYRSGEGTLLCHIGHVQRETGRYEEALGNLRRAQLLLRGGGNVLCNRGIIYQYLGRYDEAVDCLRKAVTAYREVGNRYGLGWASSELGTVHAYLGQFEPAFTLLGQALAVHREIGHRYGEGRALNGLGLANLHAERHGEALDHLHQALTLHREIGAAYPEGETVLCLAEVHRSIGDLELSRTHYLRAVEITRDTNNLRGQARAHQGLAELLLSTDPYAAAEHRRWARTICTTLGLSEARTDKTLCAHGQQSRIGQP